MSEGPIIDGFCLVILKGIYDFEPEDDRQKWSRVIVGRVLSVYASEPLSLKALKEFKLDEEDKDEAERVLRPLGS